MCIKMNRKLKWREVENTIQSIQPVMTPTPGEELVVDFIVNAGYY